MIGLHCQVVLTWSAELFDVGLCGYFGSGLFMKNENSLYNEIKLQSPLNYNSKISIRFFVTFAGVLFYEYVVLV